jgi:putative transposase
LSLVVVELTLALSDLISSFGPKLARPTYATQCKSLTTARANIPTLAAVQVQVLQQTLKRLEKAFVSMWEQKHGFPRFKKAGTMRSFVFPQLGVNPVQNQAVKLPKISAG